MHWIYLILMVAFLGFAHWIGAQPLLTLTAIPAFIFLFVSSRQDGKL